ncbi:pollen-specific protein SF3-like isoform 1, partial [Aphelenchoides avenae]
MTKTCASCKGPVAEVDETVIDRQTIHETCFVCGYCNEPLRQGFCRIDLSLGAKFGARWFCTKHQTLTTAEKRAKVEQNMLAEEGNKGAVATNFPDPPKPKPAPKAEEKPAEKPKKVSQFGAAAYSKEKKTHGKCVLCGNEVETLEQLVQVERQTVHKDCFKCAYCAEALKPGFCAQDHSLTVRFGHR